MNYDDRTRILDRLKGGWSKNLSDDTYEIWTDELEPLDFSAAYAAARQLIRTSKYFPAISEFLDAYHTHEHAQADPAPEAVCRFCQGLRFGLIDGTNDAYPCSACNTAAWEAWSRGSYQPPPPRDPPDFIDNVAERIARLKDVLADIAVHPERYQPQEVQA